VIIDNLNFVRVPLTPRKTNSPLIVDPDTVGPGTFSFQLFQLISGWNTKVFQTPSLMQIQQLTPGYALNILKAPYKLVVKQPSGVRAFERPYQAPVYDASSIMSNIMERPFQAAGRSPAGPISD
jgi:hypothetical protein